MFEFPYHLYIANLSEYNRVKVSYIYAQVIKGYNTILLMDVPSLDTCLTISITIFSDVC